MYNDKSTKSVADAVAKILEASTPKTEKEKDLAALGHPKDKITHKDVLIGRGVLKKEEAEQLDEISSKTLTNYTKSAKSSRDELNKKWTQGKASWRDKEKVINREKGEDRAHKILDRRAVIDKEMKEETESLPFTAMLESYAQGGMKAFFENFVVQEEFEQVEEEATSDEFVSELEKAKRKAAGKEKNEVSKAAVQAVQNEEVDEEDPHDRMMNTAYNAAVKAGHKPHSMGFTKDRKKVKMISDTGHGHYDIASKKYVHSKVNEEVEQLDEAASHEDVVAYADKKLKGWKKTVKHVPTPKRIGDGEPHSSYTYTHPKSRHTVRLSQLHDDKSKTQITLGRTDKTGDLKAHKGGEGIPHTSYPITKSHPNGRAKAHIDAALQHHAHYIDGRRSVKEEVEQIDELKKTTLMSYKEKNWKSTADAYNKGDAKKVSNRLKGMSLASRKLAAAAPLPMRKEEVELDEMALSADHKAALKTLKSIPSNYSHDDLKKLQAHLSDLHSKASDAERTARHAKQAEVRKANKDRSLKVSHEGEWSANYTNDDGHRLHITRDRNSGGYHAHISNAKGKYVDSGGKTTLMYNHKVGKYAKHFKEEVDHDQED